MTCICVLTAFRPSFPPFRNFKKNIGKLDSLTVRKKKKKKKKKKKNIPTDPIFKFWSGEGNITIFFFGLIWTTYDPPSCVIVGRGLVVEVYS